MSADTIVFIGSGSALTLLLIIKAIQRRFNMLLFFPKFRGRIEQRLRRRTHNFFAFLSILNMNSLYILVHACVVWLRSLTGKLDTRLDGRSQRLVSLIKGKQTIEPRDSSSHFLHDITRFRDKFRNK